MPTWKVTLHTGESRLAGGYYGIDAVRRAFPNFPWLACVCKPIEDGKREYYVTTDTWAMAELVT